MKPVALDRSFGNLANANFCRRRGVLIIWVAILGSLFLAFVMLSVDMGYVYLTAHQLQNASDSGALAGAAKVKFNQPQAKTASINAAAANYAAGQSVALDIAQDVLVGNYNRNTAAFTANGTPFNAVRVNSRRTDGAPGGPVNLFFAPIFGVDTSNVQRTATAMSGGTFGAGMVVLDPTRRSSLGENGTSLLNISNGGIQVNSSDSAAVELKGGADLLGVELRVTGGVSPGPGSTLPSTVYQNATPVEDPLKNLPAPVKGTALNAPKVTGGNVTLDPGYYPAGITQTGGTLTLNPGIYILGPDGLDVTGNSILNAIGCMFYLTTGTNPTKYGLLNLAGTGAINVTPPTSGPYAGVTVFQDRNTPWSKNANGSAKVTGTSLLNLQGTIYLPSINLTLGGTSNNLANQIIVNTVDVSGNGVLKVNYDGRNPVEINNVFLVN